MRKSIYILALVVAMGMVIIPLAAWAQMGPGYGSGYGMGPGMTGRGYGYGYGMGPGMMGPGYGCGYGRGPDMIGPGGYGPQYGPQYQRQQKTLGQEEAKQEVENYLMSTRNPNLKLGKVTDKGSYFEADVVTKGNASPVDKILVDKNTGWMRSAY